MLFLDLQNSFSHNNFLIYLFNEIIPLLLKLFKNTLSEKSN